MRIRWTRRRWGGWCRVGPGHGSVVQVQGLDHFVYHGWINAGNGTNDGTKGRQVPRIHDGSPSRSQQLWPGVP